MRKYQTAKELLATKAENKEKKPIYATRKLSIGLVSCMLGLVMATPMVFAEGEGTKATQTVEENTEQVGGTKDQNPETKETPVIIENDNLAQVDNEGGLEIGPEIASDRVTAAVKAPSVNDVLYDATTISGANLAKAKVNKEIVIATVHVTLKGKDGRVKATLSDSPTKGTKWKVDLPAGVKVEEGDTVTVYQQIGEDKSPEVTKTAQAPKASSVTLKMPTGEIWIEQTSSNIVNDDEQAEAVQKLKDANAAIADDIESVKFSIDGTEHAYYEVTYKDNSTTGKVEAPNLTVKQVTETSRSPEIDSITVVDNVIKGKLAGPGPFDKIKVQLIVNVKKEKAGNFCTDKGCKFDKDSSTPVEVTLQNDGTFSYTLQERESLTLDQIVGVSVKEPHKFVSCSTTTVKPAPIEKTEVKDPRKLTAEDKKAIDAAIRKGYTVNGESKLPNGTASGMEGIPAVIQIDDSGNVKIFSGNDVKGTWDSNYNFVPKKNDDGSYKLKDGAQPKITIEGKDLVKNIKPDAPAVALSGDKKNITITPNKLDTDAHIITVSYKDKKGKDQTTTATKADDGTWSITSGAGSVGTDGVVTIPTNLMKGGTDVKANVRDNGEYDKSNPLQSDEATLTLEKNKTKAEQITELGGLDPVVMKKWVKDKLDWKDGVKAKDDAKKDEVNNLLAGATFDDFQDDASKPKRNTDTANNTTGFVGKIKVKFDDGSELVVENQTLYVSDHVTWFSKEKTPGGEVVLNKNTPDDAIVAEFKLGKGTKIDNADGKTAIEGEESPVSYQKYKVKPGTDLKTYVHPTLQSTIYESINKKVKEQDDFIDPVWNTDNFKVTDSNKVFTATATEAFKVTVNPNGGTKAGGGEAKDIVTKVKKNGTYKLPAANTFAPPNENQEFAGWMVGKDTNLKQPNSEITINGNTEINAIWKAKEYKVRFVAGDESIKENMAPVKAKKGEYELPSPTFTPPAGKEFAGWSISRKPGVYSAGARIQISEDVTLTATWKPKSPGSSGSGSGTGTGTGETTTPGTTPEPSQPGNTPDPTPGSENPTEDKPTDPTKNPDQKDKPEDKKPGEDNKNNPKTPNVEKGDKVINVGDKEVVVPKVVVDKKKGKLDKEERTKIAEKIKEKNPDVVDVKIDEKANAYVTFNDGRRERILAKDLVSKEGFVIPRRDRHSQDESPNRRRAGKNVKTGVESIAGIACTLVASTGALYIGRKKED